MIRATASVPALLVAAGLLAGCDDLLGPGGHQILVSGQVRMASDGRPVSGARIVGTSNETGSWSQHQRKVQTTGASGEYSIAMDCPRGKTFSVFIGYEAGQSPLGEPGLDLVVHDGIRDGRSSGVGWIEERGLACTRDRSWTLDILLKPPHREPVEVSGQRHFTYLSAGAYTVCGLTADGDAYCWGNGALGDGRYRTYHQLGSTPVLVSGGHRFSTVAAGSDLTCGITLHEEAYCWGGYHTQGIGDGSLAGTPRLTPVRVVGGHQFRGIAVGGDHTCALDHEGAAHCWGNDSQGQLGRGFIGAASAVPARVSTDHRFTALVAGRHHTCGLTAEGTAYCWGYAHVLGAERTTSSPAPVGVAGEHTFTSLSSGSTHTCGITPAGEAFCWGANTMGQLGTGDPGFDSPRPARVAGGHAFSAISTGFQHTCAIAADGQAYCWGNNDMRQFGVASPALSGTPVSAVPGWRLSAIAAGHAGPRSDFTCGLEANGLALCWGANTSALGADP
jgi:alpha-tubulin suppressor-like RCC1 family protein